MKAVILAGGMGTRLRPLTYTRPKVMLPIMDKPILHYIVTSLAKQGFEEIILTTSYMSRYIRDYFKDGEEYGIKIRYSTEKKPLGTAGGVKRVEKYLDETFAVIQGDNITEIDFREEADFHRRKNAMVTIAVKPVEKPWLFGVVELDKENKIKRFFEKPKPSECFSNLASTGLYILEPEIFEYIPDAVSYDFARDLFPDLLKQGHSLYGFKTNAFWVDIGSPEGYMEACHWILSKLSRRVSSRSEIRGAIKGRVYIEDNVVIEPDVKVVGPAFIEKGVRIKRGARVGPNSFIKEEAKVGDYSYVKGSILYEHVISDEKTIMRGCIIGENCDIGRKVEIDELAVIGPNCEIGDEVRIQRGSRIWPNLRIGPRSIISGIIRRLRE